MTDHHWLGVKPEPDKYLGFIYLIKDETSEKLYVGKKQYWLVKRIKGCSHSASDKRSDGWKDKCWAPSDWRFYCGSSPTFNKWMKKHQDHTYTFHIIQQCYSKSELHYKEIEELVLRGAMWKRGADGEHLYFNRSIPAIKFRVADRTEEPSIFFGGKVD